MKKLFISSLLTIKVLALDNTLDEIVITATKLSDTQMNTSSSVDIVTQKNIEENNINNIEDMNSQVSNINISGIGNRSDKTFTFRGVSNYMAYESSIAMYIDNTPVPFTYGYGAFNMNNVQNIEVLKGPQGTLFGKNAQSGVINIFTKPTSKNLQKEFSIDLAQNNSKNIYARISDSTPVQNLQYAFSITSDTSDGYSKNTLTNNHFEKKELHSFNSKFNYMFDNNSNLKFNYIKTKIDDGGSPFKINTKQNPFKINTEPIDDFTKIDTDLISFLYTQQTKNYKFTSSTSYTKQNVVKKDYVGVSGGLILDFDINIEELSQEFKLNYDYDNFNFLIGTFYSDKLKFDYKENQNLQAHNLNSLNIIQNTDQNKALFTQMRYWMSNDLSLSVGGRYQKITKDFSRNLTNFNSSKNIGSDIKTWDFFTPTLSLLYYGQSDYNIYATYTKGYRPGGYNYRQTGNTLIPYKKEETHSYEIGYKTDSKISNFEASLFYNDISDLRINTLDDNLATTTLNAQKAYSYGVEIKANYKKQKFDLYSTLGLIKAKIKNFDSNPNQKDKNIIDVPQGTASLGLKYKITKNYYIQSNINHIGKRYYNIDNSNSLDSYTTININVGYKNIKSNILLYIKNIQDKTYNDFMISTPSNNYYHFGNPRTVGVKYTLKF